MEADCVFADDCLELVFFETLLKLEPSTFTPAMFNCFKEFFLHINASYGQIEKLALGNFKAHTNNLIGIETLWQIVLVSTDESTYKISIDFLLKLFSRIVLTNEIKMLVLEVCY